MNNDNNSDGKDSLGQAANRYVTFQIVAAVIGGIIFLIVLFTVFLPMFNHVNQGFNQVNQAMPFSSSGPQVTPLSSGGAGTGTATINGRPATPAETKEIEQQINKGHSH